MTDSEPRDRRSMLGYTRPELFWMVVWLLVAVRMGYLIALGRETGRGQGFYSFLLAIALVAAPIALLIVRQVRWPAWIVLEVIAVCSLSLATTIAPFFGSLARRNDARSATRDSVRYERDKTQHEAELTAAFAELHRVRMVLGGYVILDEGYILDALNATAPAEGSERGAYYDALDAAFTGKKVRVILDPQFATLYVPSMHSEATARHRFGKGARYGDIPATVVVDGRAVVGWKDGMLVWVLH